MATSKTSKPSTKAVDEALQAAKDAHATVLHSPLSSSNVSEALGALLAVVEALHAHVTA